MERQLEEIERGHDVNGFPEKVLLATDGLENTTLAARAAVDLARKGGAELHVVHAWHTVPSPHASGYIRSGLEENGRDKLDQQTRAIEDEGGTVAGAYLREGQTVEAIGDQAEEIGAGLIVVGSRGMGRLGRLALGSVSMGLAHSSSRPVLIVREGEGAWPPDRVLVGYDSFEDTGRAGLLGASLGRALGAGVELVAVEGDNGEARPGDAGRDLEARADEIEAAVGERPRVRPLSGDARQAFLGLRDEEEKPVLLSFGSKVLGGAGRVITGYMLDRVLSESSGPILVIPEPHPASKARILERGETGEFREGPAVLVATDGSEVSRRAGEYAARLADGLGAKLFALYVVDDNLMIRSGINYGEFVERLSQHGREATGEARARAEKAGVECEELIVLGRPDRAIIAAAEEVGADTIVLGAEGKTRVEHALIGSVSANVLRHANRTVLIVGGHPEGETPDDETPESEGSGER